jgi:hypothetical protein
MIIGEDLQHKRTKATQVALVKVTNEVLAGPVAATVARPYK